MKRSIRFTIRKVNGYVVEKLLAGVVLCLLCSVYMSAGNGYFLDDPYNTSHEEAIGQTVQDSIPLNERYTDFLNRHPSNPFDLDDPGNVKQEVEYDPETGQYIISEKIGDEYFSYPTYMTFQEYLDWRSKAQENAYFNNLTGIKNDFITLSSQEDPIEQFDLKTDLIDRLFGGNKIEIKPQGNIDISLGANFQKVLNPNIPLRQQRQGGFDFDMDIQMGVTGKIGEKLNLNFNYNTNATFSFENQLKLKFDSETFSEDDIIKNIEAGDVSLPLKSSLIQGNQSLFGLKTELQFGRLFLTTVISQQRSERENIQVQDGAQWQEFEIRADDYDADRHFFLSHFNRTIFEDALQNLPRMESLFNLKRVEVWVTSINNEFQDLRQIVAFSDLGEASEFTSESSREKFLQMNIPPALRAAKVDGVLPDNESNLLYERLLEDSAQTRQLNLIVPALTGSRYEFQAGIDFEQRRARKLPTNRYSIIPELGIISLDAQLRSDEVLAVAYEYTYNGKSFRVGEFASDVSSYSAQTDTSQSSNQILFVKMLKSSTQNVSVPMWDLMMKNVYSIGAYQASEDDFQFDIYYDDPSAGYKRFLPEEDFKRPLLEVFNLDQLNYFGDPQPDGFFDFVPGVTINTRTGKVMFPVLEPFGSSLKEYITDDATYRKYEYELLYDTTLFVAQQFQEQNRFLLKGSYKSSVSSEISLGSFNLPPNSVTVRSGGTTLTENVDYIVDYQIGKVRIINDAYLSSGAPINVSFEDRTLFGFNRQSMMGLRADYKFSKKMNLGGTFMKLWERPFTEKVNYGDDPINNSIYGLDFSYTDEAPVVTRIVDALPLIQTKEKSNIDFYAEGALLKPGHSKAINVGDDEGGVVYVDDFEGSATSILLNSQTNRWVLASVPQGHPDFPESELTDDTRIGANRALLNWYRIQSNLGASGNNPYQKFFRQEEIFPGRDFTTNLVDFRTFDLSFYPNKRGPYNFDPPEGTQYSAGLEEDNSTNECDIALKDPKSRWGGIMRDIDAVNFEAANVEAIEFWVLNPFIGGRDQDGGDLVIQIGNISEDILKDGLAFYENALPTPEDMIPVETTNLGKIATVPPVIFAFTNDNTVRELQDVGLDGYVDTEEQAAFGDYISSLQGAFPSTCVQEVFEDPANDNYKWFDDEDYNGLPTDQFLDRYLAYNHPQNNSPITQTNARISNSYTSKPDSEDLNEDGSSEKSETYYEYKVPLKSGGNSLAPHEWITDEVNTSGNDEIWYRFKIPIDQFTDKYGSITDFRSIKFIRMYMKGWEEAVTLRFAKFEFTRNQWRKVTRKIDDGVFVPGEEDVEFDLNVVNIEEHGQREPFPYILPPGIDREENYQSAFRGSFLNEQSLSLEMCNIPRQDSRGVYKVLNMNMREYERMKLFVHAETEDLQDEDLSVFVRIGSDYKNNYYEYELPLTFSDAGENGDDLQRQVWPLTNDIDIDLNALKDLKLERNENGVGRNVIYSGVQPGDSIGMIKVRGNPNLGLVNTILIGVRNNSDQDDFCAEVWLNELRLVGLDETGGAAALGRLDIQLADFGNLALSGNYSTIGWGAIDKQLLDRNREEIAAYDIATNLELGKFLPEKVGLKVPFFVQYSNNTKKPKYDPYDLDVELDEKLKSAETPSERDSIRDQAIDKTVIKTISLNNVQKQRTKQGKPMPWDISNFTASYSFTSTERTDPILEQDDITHHTGSLDYQFNLGTNYIEPFKKLIKGDKWLKFIKDINLNPIPNSFSMRNSVDRKQRQRQYRFAADDFSKSTSRQFLWNRDYRVNWDITRSIKFNYFATNKAAIDELSDSGYDFVNDVQYDMDDKQARKDYVWDNVQNFGRNKQFDQNFDISYKLPLNKFGLLDWITADLKYSATYSWNAAAINVDTFGNNISNGRDESVRLNLNFERLYNKSKFLSKINKGKSKGRGNSRVRNTNEKEDPAQPNASSKRRSAREKDVPTIARVVLRPLMTIRRARFNYTNNYSTFVPSFVMQPELLGLSSGFKAPGWDFIAGLQPDRAWFTDNAGDALDVGKADGYWSKHSCVSQEIIKGYNQRWDAQLTLEPVKDFKIDVDLERNYQRNRSVLFKLFEGETAAENEWDFGQEYEVGSYTISYLTIKTLFKDGENNIDGLFDQFKANLGTISQRLDPDGAEHPIYGSGYKLGYSLKNQEVIIPAFIAAYREVDAQTVGLDLFDEAPRPNWSLTYNGLTKIPWFKERFTRLSLTHNYKSTLTVNQYTSDLRFDDTASDPFINFDEVSQDYYSKFTFPQIVIRESMSPLIRIDVSTVNDLSFNFEYGKQRTLSLDPDNQQLNETRGTNITAGFGYTLKDVYLSFIPGAKPPKKKPKSRRGQDTNDPDNQNQDEFTGNTLKISCDFSIRDDRTKQHTWGLDITARDTRGQRAFTLSPAIDYTVNKYLTLRLFFDYRKTTPYTNLSYPITNSRGGIRFRFTLN